MRSGQVVRFADMQSAAVALVRLDVGLGQESGNTCFALGEAF